MLAGCLGGVLIWLLAGALIAWLGWLTGVLVIVVVLLLVLPWLAPDRPLS